MTLNDFGWGGIEGEELGAIERGGQEGASGTFSSLAPAAFPPAALVINSFSAALHCLSVFFGLVATCLDVYHL